VPDFTFISTASAVLCVNAVPVLVDIEPDTYCIDPGAIAAAITPRTRAIIPVHMCGQLADMDAIRDIAQKHNLSVIEDAAHAQGAEWKGQRAGTLGQAGIFSFQAFKLMTAGEGGIVISNDEAFIERAFLYGNCGRPKNDRHYQVERRHANTQLLDSLLREVPGITPQGCDPRVTRHPHYMYMFRYEAAEFGGLSRQEFVDTLVAQGIPAFVAYLAIHRTPLFRDRTFGPRWRGAEHTLPDYNRVHCPVADEISDQVVWLHHRVLLGDQEDVIGLVSTIRDIQAQARRAGGD
jgi:3-amino-5-hydroxybenzoate synthase